MNHKSRKLFLKLLMQNQAKIHAYIQSLIPGYADADDVLQNTSEIMWRRFDRFQPGTNFLSWALSCAHYEILNFRKKQSQKRECIFNNEIFEQMLPVVDRHIKSIDPRREALEHCLDKLDETGKSIINMRYNMELRPKEIGLRLGYTVDNVYKVISRMHHKLMLCIERTIRMEGYRTDE